MALKRFIPCFKRVWEQIKIPKFDVWKVIKTSIYSLKTAKLASLTTFYPPK